MSASLVYLVLRQILQMLTQFARDEGAQDATLDQERLLAVLGMFGLRFIGELPQP